MSPIVCVSPIVCEWETKDELSEKYGECSGREWESGGNVHQRFYFLMKREALHSSTEFEAILRPGNLRNYRLEVGKLGNMIYSQFTVSKSLLQE